MPTLLRFLCLLPLLAAFFSPAQAQEIQLTPIWNKFVGNINAMTFTPDSKQLLVAGGDSWVRFFNAADGRLLDSIAPKYGCWHLQYSHDGSFLVAAGDKGLDVFDAQSLKSLYTLPLDFGEYSSLYNIDISPDDKAIAVKVIVPGVDLPQDTAYQRMLIFSYPELKLQWQEDVWLAWGGNSNVFFPKGKIAFSPDGNYLLGHKGYSLVRWNWKEASHQDEILLQGLPYQELIAYSPDRKYFVLKSNYIYSIPEKKLLNPEIIGLTKGSSTEYGTGVTFTSSGNTIVVTDELFPQFVNLGSKRISHKSAYGSASYILLNPDSSLFAYQLGSDGIRVQRLSWGIVSVNSDNSSDLNLKVLPIPGIDVMMVCFTLPETTKTQLAICSMSGEVILNIYTGVLQAGEHRYPLNTAQLASGSYIVHLQSGNALYTQPFIISK